MKQIGVRVVVGVVVIALLGGLGWLIYDRVSEAEEATPQRRAAGPAPVAVASIERGSIEHRRTFSGSLESPAQFIAAAKVSGRIERLHVNIADAVSREQVIAELDNEEYQQAVAQAEAERAVAEANRIEARNKLEIAERNLSRIATLRERGVASETQYDAAKADQLAAEAAVAVAEAQITRAESALATARIRLGYTTIKGSWTDGSDQRVIAERFVEEGDTVAANAPLYSIIELNPIRAVIYVTERDYARISIGQPVVVRTDAYPGDRFTGRVARVAPIFRQASRQARVEITIPNEDIRLKPGMFIRATVVLDRAEDAVIVPDIALARRSGADGVFIVTDTDEKLAVRWQPVTLGLQDGDRVQVVGDDVSGRVVTLGHQLVNDGSEITIPDENGTPDRAEARPQ